LGSRTECQTTAKKITAESSLNAVPPPPVITSYEGEVEVLITKEHDSATVVKIVLAAIRTTPNETSS